MKVYLDPSTNVLYSSFYIDGLYKLLGKRNVIFNSKYFNGLSERKNCLLFVVQEDDNYKKVVVDYWDFQSIEEQLYDWSDLYCKINYVSTKKDFLKKLVLIPPGFGIKVWGLTDSIIIGIENFIKCSFHVPVRKFFGKYYKQYSRLPVELYRNTCPVNNDIFFISTLWDEYFEENSFMNAFRLNFIKACKELDSIRFEGGFVYSTEHNLASKYQSYILENSIGIDEYLRKIKKSVVVFNTPAYGSCHGWKLGEYLAMGKAIISTPIINDLSVPLEHGKNIHFVSGEKEEIKAAIDYIHRNDSYRKKLEKGALDYYICYIEPRQHVKLILEQLFKNSKDAGKNINYNSML